MLIASFFLYSTTIYDPSDVGFQNTKKVWQVFNGLFKSLFLSACVKHKEHFFGELIMSYIQYLYIEYCQLYSVFSFTGICSVNLHVTDFRKQDQKSKLHITIPLLQNITQDIMGPNFKASYCICKF